LQTYFPRLAALVRVRALQAAGTAIASLLRSLSQRYTTPSPKDVA
jgi:hypothetical protein